jgi:hypothetical protein
MPISLALVRKLDGVDARLKEVLYSILEEVELNREESVTKREFNELTRIVSDLGQTIKELAEAQNRTEQKLKELAEAQKRTEEELQSLGHTTKDLQKQVGGISTTLGYSVEDKAYPALPALLKRDFKLTVEGRLTRGYIRDRKGSDLEVNILGKAKSEHGKDVMIIGEGKNDVNDFIRKRLNRLQGVFPEIFSVVVTNMISEPDVEDYARQKGIALYYSYDF